MSVRISAWPFQIAQQVPEARIRVHARRLHRFAMFIKHRLQEGFHRVAEDDRVRDLHHRRLQMDREQRSRIFRRRDLLGQKRTQCFGRHESRIDDGTGGKVHAIFHTPSPCRLSPHARSGPGQSLSIRQSGGHLV